jgi:hypothetical protein
MGGGGAPRELADAFIMFAKTNVFAENEIRLAQTLSGPHRQRVILCSQDELEPYYVYARSEARLGQRQYATILTDMAQVTERLWFAPPPRTPGWMRRRRRDYRVSDLKTLMIDPSLNKPILAA